MKCLHTIGFGTIWTYLGLLDGNGTSTPTFNGDLANAAYAALANAVYYAGTSQVPVEADGSSGTAYAHWDEALLNNELMTGYINGDNDLSYVTVASLGDLGYDVVALANYVPPTFI
jgi:hypothetical protein